MIWLVSAAFAQEPELRVLEGHVFELQRPVLGAYAPTRVLHGPEGPGEIPDEGYGYERGEATGLGWLALGFAVGASGTSLGMRNAKLAMEDARCQADLDEAYTHNRRRGIATYTLLGLSATSLTLAVVF
ncbi:MAG: hypothetical protein GY913_04855 [Proteobacteria bacterium]|nr:hypothetical protein [Pseudomonadota bacterium]